MKQCYFVAGTDTGVGKTKISESLLIAAGEAGKSTLGLKPLAAGAEEINGQWGNEDAFKLQQASSVKLPYEQINPVLLKEPMAPHLAAELENKRLSVQSLTGFVRGTLMTHKADFALVEGAGGWRVPLNNQQTLADVAIELKFPVILVVGMKLGCLNHALLTIEAIERDGLEIAGWVANCIEAEMAGLQGNLTTLQRFIRAPLIGVMPHLSENSPQAPKSWLNPSFIR